MVTALLVLVAGGLGAMARFAVDALVEAGTLRAFPLGTLVVNAAGCFALGLLVGAGAPFGTKLVIGTAGIGSYTTFSTWILETHRPAEDGDRKLAWLNFGMGVLFGFAAVYVGRLLGRAA